MIVSETVKGECEVVWAGEDKVVIHGDVAIGFQLDRFSHR